jgi:hypothetical protein
MTEEDLIKAGISRVVNGLKKLAHAKPRSRKGDCAERLVPFEPVHPTASQCDDVSIRRLNQAYLNAVMVHTPVHASWSNQVDI